MTTGGFPDATVINFRHNLLDYHNRLRSHYGKRLLKIDSSLNGVAQYHSNKMAAANSMYHGDLTGKAYGQNIGAGQTTVSGIMKGWRDSCSHFYNMVFNGWTIVGFGISKSKNGTYYWTADFGGGSSSPCFSNYCPSCSCNSCSGHSFFSNDAKRPGGSKYFF